MSATRRPEVNHEGTAAFHSMSLAQPAYAERRRWRQDHLRSRVDAPTLPVTIVLANDLEPRRIELKRKLADRVAAVPNIVFVELSHKGIAVSATIAEVGSPLAVAIPSLYDSDVRIVGQAMTRRRRTVEGADLDQAPTSEAIWSNGDRHTA